MVDELVQGSNRRVCLHLDGVPTHHCALMPSANGFYFITINKALRTELNWIEGASRKAVLTKDTSEYGMDIPQELEELFEQEVEAYDSFLKLTKGKQRSLIYWVKQVKSPEIILRRALVMLRHVHAQNGDIDYKKLNAEIKEANRRF